MKRIMLGVIFILLTVPAWQALPSSQAGAPPEHRL
jgi:hypothetical protein